MLDLEEDSEVDTEEWVVVVNMAVPVVPVVPAATEAELAVDTSSRAVANKADKED